MNREEACRLREETAASALRGETSELDTFCIHAFGIKLVSQSGSSSEMSEMLCFTKQVASEQLAGAIEGVLYANGCAYLRPCFPLDCVTRNKLCDVARNTFSKFDIGTGTCIGNDPSIPY